MISSDEKRIRKCVMTLKSLRDDSIKKGSNTMAVKFAQAAAILIEILTEMRNSND